MIARTPPRLIAGLALLLAVSTPRLAPAQDRKPDAYQPGAMKLLGEVANAYHHLPGYADKGELTVSLKAGDKSLNKTTRRSVAFSPPGKIVLDYESLRLIDDGKVLTAVIVPNKKYVQAPAPSTISARTLATTPLPLNLNALMFMGEGGLPTGVIVDLVGGTDAVKSILEGTDGLKLEEDRQQSGKTVKSLLVDQSKGPDMRILVDPETKLVSAVELVYNLAEVQTQTGVKYDRLSVVWNANEVARQADPAQFSFKPNDGLTPFVAPGKPDVKANPDRPAAEQKAEEPTATEKLIGSPAPDFTLTVLEADGKTREVRKADLTGKVVLIDFWATWCGPCLKELPEIQKLIESLAKDKKDVVVIAASEDDDPSEPDKLRKAIETTLSEHKIKVDLPPVGRVALDPKLRTGELFKVEAIPTLVLIDAKGVIRSVHVGYSEDVRATLSREIDALLEGKPLDETKPKPSAGEAK